MILISLNFPINQFHSHTMVILVDIPRVLERHVHSAAVMQTVAWTSIRPAGGRAAPVLHI